MRAILAGAALAGAVPAVADDAPSSPVAVVRRHVAAMKRGDLAAVMRDYAADAVVVAPHGMVAGVNARGAQVFTGPQEARRVFATLTDAAHHPGVAGMRTVIEGRGPRVALLHWVQYDGTPERVSGEDVFVVRDGKIEHQAILVGVE